MLMLLVLQLAASTRHGGGNSERGQVKIRDRFAGFLLQVVQKGDASCTRHTQPFANHSKEWRESLKLSCLVL